MAYYDAFVTFWNTQNGSTAQKLTAVNAALAASPKPSLLTINQVFNAIVLADYVSLTQLQQSQLANLLSVSNGGSIDGSSGTLVRAWFASIFAGKASLTNLNALVSPFDNAKVPWWEANGYLRAFDMGDVTAAGVS